MGEPFPPSGMVELYDLSDFGISLTLAPKVWEQGQAEILADTGSTHNKDHDHLTVENLEHEQGRVWFSVIFRPKPVATARESDGGFAANFDGGDVGNTNVVCQFGHGCSPYFFELFHDGEAPECVHAVTFAHRKFEVLTRGREVKYLGMV